MIHSIILLNFIYILFYIKLVYILYFLTYYNVCSEQKHFFFFWSLPFLHFFDIIHTRIVGCRYSDTKNIYYNSWFDKRLKRQNENDFNTIRYRYTRQNRKKILVSYAFNTNLKQTLATRYLLRQINVLTSFILLPIPTRMKSCCGWR